MDAYKEKVASSTQKLSQDYELIATCFHEAGHTVAGLLNFMKIPVVTVSYTSKSVEGLTHYEMFEYSGNDQKVNGFMTLSEIYISYAGLISERIYYKDICGADKLPMILKEGSSIDIGSASEIIRKNELAAPGKKTYAFKQRVYKELTVIFNTYWLDIKLISHALYKRKRLYYSDLKAILTKKSKNKAFWKNRFKEIDFLADSKIIDDKEIRSILFQS